MDRVKWINHQGKEILLIDYSGLKSSKNKNEILGIIETFKDTALKKGGKILFLSDVTNAYTDREVFSELKNEAKFCADNDLIEKECIVGVTGVKKALVNIVNRFAKTNLVLFNSREEAKSWLIE
ncbi:MAG: hypothetical protein ACFE8U_09595 [Candidatus Hermodarchaeota archaeon]